MSATNTGHDINFIIIIYGRLILYQFYDFDWKEIIFKKYIFLHRNETFRVHVGYVALTSSNSIHKVHRLFSKLMV